MKLLYDEDGREYRYYSPNHIEDAEGRRILMAGIEKELAHAA
jgi:hypothetical protein